MNLTLFASLLLVSLVVPADVPTYPDGRAPIESIYEASLTLVEQGWTATVITNSAPAGTTQSLPIVAFTSPAKGPAVWILAGVHGEEPAGPNAIAAAIEDIVRLGQTRPVVLLPLLNPHGYARNWRYLNVATYTKAIDGHSVGDSSHLLPTENDSNTPRAAEASNPEAAAITSWILARQADYPVVVSIDLHEDNLIHQGYVYSQGKFGTRDPLAVAAVDVLRTEGVPIKMSGLTRFDEPIENGIIGPVADSSVDELLSTAQIIEGGALKPGPKAITVLVLETPAAAMTLEKRTAAQAAVLRLMANKLAVPNQP